MKNTNLATAVGMTTLLCAGITVSGYAQQGAGGVGGPGGRGHIGQLKPGGIGAPTPAILKAGEDGVFSLRGGSLVKLDPESMKQIKSVLLAETAGNPEDRMGNGPQHGHPAPATINFSKGKVLVVIGNQFYSVDAKSMKLIAKASFQTPKRAENSDRPGMGPQGRPGGPQDNQQMNGRRGPGGPQDDQQMNGRRGPGGPQDDQQMNGRRGPGGPQDDQQMNGRRGPGGPQDDQQMNGRRGPGGPQDDQQMNGRRGPGGPQDDQQMNGRRGPGGPQGHMAPPPASIEVHGDVAYIVAGPQTIAVDINRGKVLSTSELPELEDR
ncbi:MAG: hypothetical protein ACYC1M_09310 [Armatimonadota bacterium]